MSILDSALNYAKNNIPVFPVHGITTQRLCTCQKTNCPPPGKHPILSGGFNIASTDPNTIITWWNKFPFANIGIPTGNISGLYIVDIDQKNGGIEGYKEFKESSKEDIPNASLISNTGGGGFHLIYKAPS